MFCNECGRQLASGDRFCCGCGTRVPAQAQTGSYRVVPQSHNAVDAVRSRPAAAEAEVYTPVTPVQPKKKSRKGKIWGIILVVLELLVLLTGMDEVAGMGIFELLGFLTPGIIGVVLLIRAYKK